MAKSVDYEQFKGKPFQVISKLGVRYTGIFESISQQDQTICLAEVYNHGTEDRPTARKIPARPTSLGWVLFHTESIESLAIINDHVPPGAPHEDPIIAAVGTKAPPAAFSAPAPQPQTQSLPQPPLPPISQPQYQPLPRPQHQPSPPPPQLPVHQVSSRSSSQSGRSSPRIRHELPARPDFAQSASTALDRIQRSISDLHVTRQTSPKKHAPPAVPDAEFDFSAGTQVLEKERELLKRNQAGTASPSQVLEEVGIPERSPHPAAIVSNGDAFPVENDNGSRGKSSSAYNKKSFFDGLSVDSARTNRMEERSRNLDTFGEPGVPSGPMGNGMRGRGMARGGYQGQSRGGYQGGNRGGYQPQYMGGPSGQGAPPFSGQGMGGFQGQGMRGNGFRGRGGRGRMGPPVSQ
ncbi:hypothetical protein TREMEDRAFT_73067 [Tremella mesenterica DSM 1558]|uniref:uncharacterized protein n=1 Tax=Tremella mesenterica (strain ATCC 24925 / CBS 8224 / DSM 1558 / NBRC 9311 / NRRL Y-6157 / RJB 2259-6 / UBC 559-6) TaxID=578456 RepID=UPI0003F49093|nr:uncharacterized protein TREMEDRAFT_73067 [Tremella mesenterica DSM 1558]EIW73421.1 hypothetical protein TREMEDRAFT_73067 [Tremella mesenterica DSM 1558]